jgi:adenylylsulfate kinase-like enzyme
VRALFLNGSVGAGKTTTAEAVGRLLGRRSVPHAVIDLDWLRCAWPSPERDPFNHELELRNLTAVAANYRAAGAQLLVLAGVISSSAGWSSRYRCSTSG